MANEGAPSGGKYQRGGLELKCPKLSTHLRYLRTPDEVPSAYWLQVQFSLWVSDLPRWWFMSWAGWPNVPALLVEVEPDETTQTALDEVMPEVLGEIAERKAWLASEGVEPAVLVEWEGLEPAQ